MIRPKSRGATASAVAPRLGASVMVRVPFFAQPTVGICIAVFDEEPLEIAVQAFPLGRDSLQLPAVPFFANEPDATVRSAAWPA